MSLGDAVAQGLELGRRQAAPPAVEGALEAARPFQGYLIVEGDSWFSLPIYDEVTEALRKGFNYKTRSSSHHGDTAQEMALLPRQLADFETLFKELAEDKHVARAILISGGGNDVMDALSALLNPRGGGVGTWHPAVVEAVIREQVPFALAVLIGRAIVFSERYFGQKRPILLHGYGEPVPDGRGFTFGITLSGPWMKPVFARKGYVSDDPQPTPELQRNADAMAELMTVFNQEVLPEVANKVNQQQGQPIVRFVDVRSALSRALAQEAYRMDWGDELHPTGDGFAKVAGRINDAIVAAAPEIPPDMA